MIENRLASLLSGRGDWALGLRDWEQLLSQARRASLSARLAQAAAAALPAGQIPARVGQHLDAATKIQVHIARTMCVEVDRVSQALRGAGVDCTLLKGTAYLTARLPPARARVFGDIDVLVARADLERAESALFGAGWLSTDLGDYNQRYYREWMHEIPPLIHMTRASVIDLHHTITPPTSAFNVDGQRLLDAARPVGHESHVLVLQPVDMVLHSAVHLFTEGEFDRGLRDLLDMDDLLQHFTEHEPRFWVDLCCRADALGLRRPLYYALSQIERLFGPRVPEAQRAALSALQPPWPQRALMSWLLRVVLRPNHPSCLAAGDGLARWLLFVRSHWLRMPLRLLVPHLLRKAWMGRFPPKKPDAAPATR